MVKKNKKMKVKFTPGFEKDFKRLFSSNPIYAIPRWLVDIKLEIKWAWQRVFREYDDRWYWNLDNHLSWIIPKCVKHMRESGTSCPQNFYDKKIKGDECYKWKEVLKKIAKGFEARNTIYIEDLHKGMKYERLDKDFKEGIKLLAKHFNSLWD